jgi:mono/diheme cytochrome c family protein
MPNIRLVIRIACLVPLCFSTLSCSSSDEPATHPDTPSTNEDPAEGAGQHTKTDAGSTSSNKHNDAGSTTTGGTHKTDAGSGGTSVNDPPGTTPGTGADPSDDVVTYQRDLRPLLENNCIECHTEGGIGPSALDDWATVKTLGSAIVGAVTAGRMPPWPASDDCHPIQDARSLSADTKSLFEKWEAGGFQEGNAADYVPPTKKHRLELGAPALTMKGDEAYTPAANGDSYRCFFAGSVPADTFITALDIVPSMRAEVHHVILNRVNAADVEAVKNQDKNAAGGGYPCSSAGVGGAAQSQNLFSYRPGGVTVVMNEGEAVYLKAGSGLVLQVHYNTQFLPSGVKPGPDQTQVEIWTMPAGKTPDRVIYRTGLLGPLNGSSDGALGGGFGGNTMTIPANNAHVVGETTLKMSGVSVLGSGLTFGAQTGKFLPGEIVGMTPHAHAWASRMVASLKPTSGGEQCLIEVKDWDYNWQLDYLFKDGVPYTADDVLHLECDYDNTADNQPIVNGTKHQVAAITFGESTLNEMCEHYLWLRFKYSDFKAASP